MDGQRGVRWHRLVCPRRQREGEEGGGGVLEGCSLAVGGEEWGRGQRLGWAGLGFERGLWGNTLTRS